MRIASGCRKNVKRNVFEHRMLETLLCNAFGIGRSKNNITRRFRIPNHSVASSLTVKKSSSLRRTPKD